MNDHDRSRLVERPDELLSLLPLRASMISRRLERFSQSGWDINALALMHADAELLGRASQALGLPEPAAPLLGMAALWLVSQVGPFRNFEQIPGADSFGWTALTTVVEGALMAVVIGLIALVVLGCWRLTAGTDSKSEFFPV